MNKENNVSQPKVAATLMAPVEPTGVMKDAGANSLPVSVASTWLAADVYRAMVAVAPSQPKVASIADDAQFLAALRKLLTAHNQMVSGPAGIDLIAAIDNFRAPADQHPDDMAVQAFADAMKSKMAKCRAKGRGGWEECHAQDLRRMLVDHMQKGDPVDVGNFAMMLWNRSESTAPADQAASLARIADLEMALRYYADGNHFMLADPDAWDTVSGEPVNFQCDEAGTATVEDGTLAKMVLAGEPMPSDGEEVSITLPKSEGAAQSADKPAVGEYLTCCDHPDCSKCAGRGGIYRVLAVSASAADGSEAKVCVLPSSGWSCSRGDGHKGPCAASLEDDPENDMAPAADDAEFFDQCDREGDQT